MKKPGRASFEAAVRVLPIGAVSQGRDGRQLAELAALAEAGCVALSDDRPPVADGARPRRALEYARSSGLTPPHPCDDPALPPHGHQ